MNKRRCRACGGRLCEYCAGCIDEGECGCKADAAAATAYKGELELTAEMLGCTLAEIREKIGALQSAIGRILDAGEWEWSEADDTMIYSIHLPESSVREFETTAGLEMH